jgi:hypothetical protein
VIEEFQSSNHRPGEPLRSWTSSERVTGHDFRLLVEFAGARSQLVKIAQQQDLSVEDIVVLAGLNSRCVQDWYEPMTTIISGVHLNSGVLSLIQDNFPEASSPSAGGRAAVTRRPLQHHSYNVLAPAAQGGSMNESLGANHLLRVAVKATPEAYAAIVDAVETVLQASEASNWLVQPFAEPDEIARFEEILDV